MEHDEEIPAIVRADHRSTTASIAGGDGAVAVVPPLEPGGGSTGEGDGAEEEETAPEGAATTAASAAVKNGKGAPKGKRHPNNVRRLRIERMMSKAELARRANLSVLTIDRVEKGYGCRMDSKRKILEALGLSLGDRVRVFGEEE